LALKEIPAGFKYFKKMVLCQAKLWRRLNYPSKKQAKQKNLNNKNSS